MTHSPGSLITGGSDHTNKTIGGSPFDSLFTSTDPKTGGKRRRKSGKKSKKGKKSRGGKKRGRKSRKSRKK